MDAELIHKHNLILINEKKSVIAGLKQRLLDLETIESKKLYLKIEILEREIKFLESKCVENKDIN